MKIAVLGGGNMGATLAEAFVRRSLVQPRELLILEQDDAKREDLERRLSCRTSAEAGPLLSEFDLFLLAVKPQDGARLCEMIRPILREGHIVLSVMAGISTASLRALLGEKLSIVRAMPNTPAQIGRGVTAYFTAAGADIASFAERLLGCVGTVLRVSDEEKLHAVTAISGSGPAYVFYLIEQLLEICADFGFTDEESRLLVAETVRGSIDLWTGTKSDPATLRAQVTSKGGTTEAAINVFSGERLADALKAGIRAARERSIELASLNSLTPRSLIE